jgi:magnesium-transporting ATPase (P-type)
MATGDNTLTAISVGRDCYILQRLQDVYFPEIIDNQVVWKHEQNDEVCQDPFEWGPNDFGVALNG